MKAHATEFHAERRSGIGGSDVAPILGLPNPGNRTALQVWAEKTGRAEPTPDNAYLRRGRRLEPVVRDEYEEETGRRVVTAPELFVHATIPYLIGHVDGFIQDPDREPEDAGILEAKSANAFMARAWEDEAPLAAQVQLQHYLLVTGRKWGSVAGLIGGLEFRYQDAERNEELLAGWMLKAAEFWKHVKDDTAPDPVAADAKTIGRIFQAIEGKSVDLGNEAIQWDLDRLKAAEEIKRFQQLKDEADAKLKHAIGEAERGKLPNGVSYTFKTVARKGYEVAPTSYRDFRRSAAR